MVTRLRSEKGSFVQSPKRAFDSEAPSGFTGVIDIVDEASLLATVRDAAQGETGSVNCDLPLVALGIVGYQATTFSFDTPPTGLTIAQLLAGSYTGRTSGATYVPNTYWAPATLTQWCSWTDTQFTNHVTTDFIAIGSGVSSAPQIVRVQTPGTIRTSIVAHVNYNQFLIPKLGFTNLEVFDFVP